MEYNGLTGFSYFNLQHFFVQFTNLKNQSFSYLGVLGYLVQTESFFDTEPKIKKNSRIYTGKTGNIEWVKKKICQTGSKILKKSQSPSPR